MTNKKQSFHKLVLGNSLKKYKFCLHLCCTRSKAKQDTTAKIRKLENWGAHLEV